MIIVNLMYIKVRIYKEKRKNIYICFVTATCPDKEGVYTFLKSFGAV